MSCGASDTQHQSSAERLYHTHCIRCHGTKGNLGVSGAADLTKSIRSHADKIILIKNGKGNMPKFANTLSDSEIENFKK